MLRYSIAAIFASVFYILWLAIEGLRTPPGVSLEFAFGFALFFWLAGGFGPALIVLALPWTLVEKLSRKSQSFRPIYFPVIGALLTFALGCSAASLMPKPFFIEDQSFIEGAMITAARQGLCLLLAGTIFGSTYWWLSDRHFL